MNNLTIAQTKEMLLAVADAIIESKPLLTEIDSKIGDGDHGIGMAGGLEKAKAELFKLEVIPDINTLFKTTGMAMLNSMGGASGVIFGSMFLGGIKNLASKSALDGDTFRIMMRKALDSIKDRGKAQVGDKTMVDALEPAVLAMEASENDDLEYLLFLAEDAAKLGVENTKIYMAKFGRAKSLLERAIGYQDAGATSTWIIFKAMYDYVKALA